MDASFSFLLRTHRKDRGLTQLEVSRATGIGRRRLSLFETEEAVPRPEERELLARFFGRKPEDFGLTEPRRSYGRRSHFPLPCGFLRSFGRSPRLHKPDRRVKMRARIHSAVKSWPELRQTAREALAEESFAAFSRAATCESADEAVLWVGLAHQGARHARVSLARVNWDNVPVVAYDEKSCLCGRPMPAMYVTKPARMVFFPQVQMKTPFGARRVDVLVALGQGRTTLFFAVEVNGPGHRDRGDLVRHQELNMPVVFLGPEDLRSPDLAGLILRRLEVLVDRAA